MNYYVEEEVKHWNDNPNNIFPHHRIIVGGFSQGCSVALKYGL